MNVLYIGATGLVGSQVVPELKEKHDLTLAALGGGEIEGLPVADLDIKDFEATAALVEAGNAKGERFDAVVNCAIAEYRGKLSRDPESYFKYYENCIDVNARGAYHIYEAAWRAKVPRTVYVGSMTAMLGHPQYDVIDTESRDRPTDIYAAAKIFGEHAGRYFAYRHQRDAEYSMRVLCLRLGQPYRSFSFFDDKWKSMPRARAMAADARDIAQAIDCALHVDVQFGTYPIVSGSDQPYVDPLLYAELGYRPNWKFTEEGVVPTEPSDDFTPKVPIP